MTEWRGHSVSSMSRPRSRETEHPADIVSPCKRIRRVDLDHSPRPARSVHYRDHPVTHRSARADGVPISPDDGLRDWFQAFAAPAPRGPAAASPCCPGCASPFCKVTPKIKLFVELKGSSGDRLRRTRKGLICLKSLMPASIYGLSIRDLDSGGLFGIVVISLQAASFAL